MAHKFDFCLSFCQRNLCSNASARILVCGILTALATIGATQLAVFDPIRIGLDASWIASLGDAAARGDIFGRDVISTSGPLNSLYSHYFDSQLWPFVILAGALIGATVVWSCGRLASHWLTALLLPSFIFIAPGADSVFMVLPALAAFAVLVKTGARWQNFHRSALLTSSGE
jgi:hypothetical protein